MKFRGWFFYLLWKLSRKSRVGCANYLYTWVGKHLYEGTLTFRDLVGEETD